MCLSGFLYELTQLERERSDIEFKSKSDLIELEMRPELNQEGLEARSDWELSEIEVIYKWDRSEADVPDRSDTEMSSK